MLTAPIQSALKYRRVADALREDVANLESGARLPAERRLASRFGCSVLTVRKGMAQLVEEGIIDRRIGSGTFVTDRDIQQGSEDSSATHQIGLLALMNTTSYGHQVLQAMARAASPLDIDLHTAWVDDFGTAALAEVDRLAGLGCTALALPWFPHELSPAVGEFARKCPLPISLPLLIPGLEAQCFESPSTFGQSTMTCTDALCEYFVALGHDHIALLGPNSASDAILQAKLCAYSVAMSRLGRENICGLVGSQATDMDALAMRWTEGKRKLAIIAYDDVHALRFVTAMHKFGLSAPNDFAIIGFNNSESAAYCDPPLSSLDQDFDYIGRGLLLSACALSQGKHEQSSEPPPHRLITRATCGGMDTITPELANRMLACGLALADNKGNPFYTHETTATLPHEAS